MRISVAESFCFALSRPFHSRSYLRYNALSGNLPSSWSSMTNMQYLCATDCYRGLLVCAEPPVSLSQLARQQRAERNLAILVEQHDQYAVHVRN